MMMTHPVSSGLSWPEHLTVDTLRELLCYVRPELALDRDIIFFSLDRIDAEVSAGRMSEAAADDVKHELKEPMRDQAYVIAFTLARGIAVAHTVKPVHKGPPVEGARLTSVRPLRRNPEIAATVRANGLLWQPQHRSLEWGTGTRVRRRPVPEGVLVGEKVAAPLRTTTCCSKDMLLSTPFQIQYGSDERIYSGAPVSVDPESVRMPAGWGTCQGGSAPRPLLRKNKLLTLEQFSYYRNRFVRGDREFPFFHLTRMCLSDRLQEERDGLRSPNAPDSVRNLLQAADDTAHRLYGRTLRHINEFRALHDLTLKQSPRLLRVVATNDGPLGLPEIWSAEPSADKQPLRDRTFEQMPRATIGDSPSVEAMAAARSAAIARDGTRRAAIEGGAWRRTEQ